jgi:deoxyribodipyrimidine photolyase
MRELNKTGWISKSIRMLTSYFLLKLLRIYWEKNISEKGSLIMILYLTLLTGIIANTARLRKFNILKQQKKYDMNGEYIRKCIEELRNVPDIFIHESWKMEMKDIEGYCFDYPLFVIDENLAFIEFKKSIKMF